VESGPHWINKKRNKMSKNEDFTDYRQICFKLEMEIKDRQKELVEVMRRYVPKGSMIDVKRGKRVWKNIKVVAISTLDGAGYVVGDTKHGEGGRHHFYWKDIVCVRREKWTSANL